jgi:hypothetical protein
MGFISVYSRLEALKFSITLLSSKLSEWRVADASYGAKLQVKRGSAPLERCMSLICPASPWPQYFRISIRFCTFCLLRTLPPHSSKLYLRSSTPAHARPRSAALVTMLARAHSASPLSRACCTLTRSHSHTSCGVSVVPFLVIPLSLMFYLPLCCWPP